MSTPRRVYIYAVSAISLNAVTWAIISLLRNLLISKFNPSITGLAFQTAVILIGLPVFLVHWMWGQRLANRDEEERGAVLRRIYLYGMQAAFLIPIITSASALLSTLLLIPQGRTPRMLYPRLSSGESVLHYIIAILVLGILCYYHVRVQNEDAKLLPETGTSAVVRRLFVLSFSACGLGMTIVAIVNLVRWLLFQIGGEPDPGISTGLGPIYEIARLVIGLPVWLIFWSWAERLFKGPNDEERESALRKFYLYFTIFISVLASVTSITYILEGFFRRLLDVPPSGLSEGDIRIPLSIIIGAGVAWAYHAYVLRDDAKLAKDVPRQERIRRLYYYLVAGIGLAAFLIGISGNLSILIRSLEHGAFGIGLKRQFTWFVSATLAGLPVWFLPWWRVQDQSVLDGAEGAGERRSTVRKIYLYFFVFIATMTVLSSVIFITFKILSMIFGDPAPTISELGQPLAYSIIAAGVLLYHGYALREDQKLSLADQVVRYEGIRVAIVDLEDGEFLQAVSAGLKKAIPGISVNPIVLAQESADKEEITKEQDVVTRLKQATIIVGPWMMTVPNWAEGMVSEEIARAVLTSPAQKVLIPSWIEGWEWAGVERLKNDALVRQTTRAIGQVLEGEEVRPVKPLGVGAIIAIIIAAFILLSLISIPVNYLLNY